MSSKLYRDINENHNKINNKSGYKRETFDIFGILLYPITFKSQFDKLFKDSKNKKRVPRATIHKGLLDRFSEKFCLILRKIHISHFVNLHTGKFVTMRLHRRFFWNHLETLVSRVFIIVFIDNDDNFFINITWSLSLFNLEQLQDLKF